MCVACNHTIHRKNHNFAWSRDFAAALRCKTGETIHFECLDAGDGHFKHGSTFADVATLDFSRVNPVTGPVYVEGAQPGWRLAECLHGERCSHKSHGLALSAQECQHGRGRAHHFLM